MSGVRPYAQGRTWIATDYDIRNERLASLGVSAVRRKPTVPDAD